MTMSKSNEATGIIDTESGKVANLTRQALGVSVVEWLKLSNSNRIDLMDEYVEGLGYADISAVEFGTGERI
jgi:hypothetical protein